MYARRVTVTGFKSFAHKTELNLEPGITAIVGPNGSGKSNLADAVRWVLGEQGKTRLRLSDREEVVFAGTSKQARASFAEVALLFDNEDGGFPLDLTEVEISRRLYRSGESEYRLAGRKVPYGDIQALLAQAGVGAGSYAVIGQGMIDTILMSSPAERKLLFNEAAGIRGPELGREAALRKLSATETNLTRLRDLAAELAPRLGALTSAVDIAAEQASLEAAVARLRQALVSARHAHWSARHGAATDRLEGLDRQIKEASAVLDGLEKAATRAEEAEAKAATRRKQLLEQVAELEQARDRAVGALADQRGVVAEARRAGEIRANLEAQDAAIASELVAASRREDDLKAEIAANTEAAARAAKAVEKAAREVATAQESLVAVRTATEGGVRDQYLDHALALLKTLATDLGHPELTLDQIRLVVHKAGRLLSHATRAGAEDLAADLKTAQKQLESAMARRETATEHQTNVSITGRSLEIDLSHQKSEIARFAERRAHIATELAPLARLAGQLETATKLEHEANARLEDAIAGLETGRSELSALGQSHPAAGDGPGLPARLERARIEAASLETARTAASAEVAEAAAGLADSAEAARAWGLTPAAPPVGQTMEAVAEQLMRAEAQLEARTTLHQEQVQQYQEATARSEELTTQISDLETAQSDLKQLVAELDAVIKVRFKDNFQALAAQFRTYFERLFEGGSASLELTETEDGNFGIEVKASPGGKRLTSIAALSGGERAMAGVALVAAILRVSPSPFVVLDEIDAALDEANSGRLASILSELQEHSQLIVITHNRQTMQAARVLLGVSMDTHHVSRLISLQLEEAARAAAR
ncbi:MAG TPA: chromosome segregation SMC family protein [Candidatus Saccharimonadia bacterium]|nr:chromosome segregation SMC family protein [Candidatus Saccharimonadia bacterium]